MTSLLLCSFQDLKEKKEVVEETENGRDAPANGNAVSIATICRERQPLHQHFPPPPLLAFAASLSPVLPERGPLQMAALRCAVPLTLWDFVQQLLPSLWALHVCAERKGWAWISPLPESCVRFYVVPPPS